MSQTELFFQYASGLHCSKVIRTVRKVVESTTSAIIYAFALVRIAVNNEVPVFRTFTRQRY